MNRATVARRGAILPASFQALKPLQGSAGQFHVRIRRGDLVWRTHDPELDKAARPYLEASSPIRKQEVHVRVVARAGQPLITVIPLDRVWITANFKETQLSNMRVGQRVLVDVDAYGGRDLQGKVESIAAATGARFSLLPPENATGNFVKVVQRVPVKIVLDEGQDPDRLLRPGMSVTPTVYTR